MPEAKNTISTRQLVEDLFEGTDLLGALGSEVFAQRLVAGFAIINIFGVSDQPFTVSILESCSPVGACGTVAPGIETFLFTATLDPITGLYFVCERISPCGTFMQAIFNNTGAAQTIYNFCVNGLPHGTAGGGTGDGAQGAQGRQGNQGNQGNQGTGGDGNQGFQGRQGFQGAQGFQGFQGFQGLQGVQGPQGFQGFQGNQGFQGLQGLQGPQGWQGIQGVQGPQGNQGNQGTAGAGGGTGVQGPQGFQGIQGPQGWQGIQGVQGPQGWQGIQGVQGPQGFQGNQGVQGNQGWQGFQGPSTGGAANLSTVLYADQMDNPNNADWVVNALAPANPDPTNNALTIRAFDDTTEEGVGWILPIPAATTTMTIKFKSRGATAPAATRTVGLKLYNRDIPDNAAITAWSAGVQLTDISIPTNAFYQYDSQAITYVTLGIVAGETAQFELTRVNPSGGTELVGDWYLLEIIIEFS